MAAIKIVGGTTVAEDESSAVVFGMPKAAIDSGAVDSVVPLWNISNLILEKQVERKSYRGTTATEKILLAKDGALLESGVGGLRMGSERFGANFL
jgi:hypothetical protein